MNRIILLLGFVVLAACEPDSNEAALEWSKGGTLQNATVLEWRDADEKIQLATCADFLMTIKKTRNEKYLTYGEFEVDASNLKECVNKSINASEPDLKQPVVEIAMACKSVGK